MLAHSAHIGLLVLISVYLKSRRQQQRENLCAPTGFPLWDFGLGVQRPATPPYPLLAGSFHLWELWGGLPSPTQLGHTCLSSQKCDGTPDKIPFPRSRLHVVLPCLTNSSWDRLRGERTAMQLAPCQANRSSPGDLPISNHTCSHGAMWTGVGGPGSSLTLWLIPQGICP